MPQYNYSALKANGQQVSSTAEAPSLSVLAARLAAEGYTIKTAGESRSRMPRVRGIPFFEVTAIYRQIASSIEAGLPLVETLEMLSGESRNMRLRSLLYFLKTLVAEGVPLSEAMKQFPDVFPSVHAAVVKAGEESGQLGTALDELADQAETMSNMNRRFASSLVYPTVIALAALVLMNGAFMFIIPKFETLFGDLGVMEFPTVTRFVFFISQLVFPVTLLLIAAVVILASMVTIQRRAASGRLWLDQWKLRIPIMGQIVEKAALARFSGMLGLLLTAGIELPRAVRLASEGAGNGTVERLLKNLSAQVEMGETLSSAIEKTDAMPATLAWRIGVGEETGNLPDALLRMSKLYAGQVDSLVTSFAGMLEPILIIVIGSGVAAMVIGLFMPLAAIVQSLTGYTG